MGKEAACDVVAGDASGTVKAHLDGKTLRLTGSVRRSFELSEIRHSVVRGEALHFEADGERVALALGAKAAAAWAKAIAHPKTRVEKLDLKPGHRVCAIGLDESFAHEIATVTGAEPLASLRGSFDAIFLAIDGVRDLERIATAKTHLHQHGALWLIFVKGKSAPVHEHVVRQASLDAGLVDTKVVSFSATHTAAKVVIPVAARKVPRPT